MIAEPTTELATSRAASDEPVTYYGRPVLKEPVWIWSVPCYFFAGGVGGAAMTLGLAVQIFGGKRLQPFDGKCRWVGAIGGGLGSALLIYDLGRKARFLAMLRVFRPTSPMSVGSWILAVATPLSAGSALFTSKAAGAAAGILGMPLATYTAVLLSNSAVPVWLATRRTLPLLFASSSASSLASVLELAPLAKPERAIVRRFGAAARIADIVAARAVEREACADPRVGRPLKEGVSGALWKAAKILTVSSLILSLAGRRKMAGTLGVIGGLALRFAVMQAGKASARDPLATFGPQHE